MIKKLIERLKKDRYWFNVTICLALVLLLLSVPFLLVQFGRFNVSETSQLYETRASKSVSDKVVLKDNDIFVTDGEGYYSSDFYIANLLDSVRVDFYDTLNLNTVDYDLNFVKTLRVVLVVEGEDGVILEEENEEFGSGIIKQENGNQSGGTAVVDLNENIELQYETYTSRFNFIHETLGISCFATLEVHYEIDCFGTVNGHNYSYQDSFVSFVPVQTSGTLSVANQYTSSTALSDSEITYHNEANYFWLIFGFLLDIVAIVLIGVLTYVIVQKMRENSGQKRINKIIGQYEDILVKIEKPLERDLPVLELDSFDDVVKVETELSSPIVWLSENEKYDFFIYAPHLTYHYSFKISEDEKEQNVEKENAENNKKNF